MTTAETTTNKCNIGDNTMNYSNIHSNKDTQQTTLSNSLTINDDDNNDHLLTKQAG